MLVLYISVWLDLIYVAIQTRLQFLYVSGHLIRSKPHTVRRPTWKILMHPLMILVRPDNSIKCFYSVNNEVKCILCMLTNRTPRQDFFFLKYSCFLKDCYFCHKYGVNEHFTFNCMNVSHSQHYHMSKINLMLQPWFELNIFCTNS